MIFRQLFEPTSFTYTYLLGCAKTRKALLIDPVLETVERDSALIRDLHLDLAFVLNTHIHADHITGSGKLKSTIFFPFAKSVLSKASGGRADILAHPNEHFRISPDWDLEVRSTPGHTNGCVTFVCHAHKMMFTGDALLIRGCGRTDFQEGNSRLLYRSVHKQILCLPHYYKIFPAHDYTGRMMTTVAEELEHNPRLTKSEDKFVEIMENLNLPKPKQIEKAVPANMVCGLQDLMNNN